MRKVIYTIATAIIFSLAFTSCEEKNGNGNGNGYENGNGIRKLPSRIVLTNPDFPDETGTWTFRYDEQNRMTEFRQEWETDWDTSGIICTIEYDANNKVSKITHTRFRKNPWNDFLNYYYTDVYTFQHIGNQVHITAVGFGYSGRMTLNANGQITRWEWETDMVFTYTNENLTQIKVAQGETVDFSYSNVLNIFRNVASPDWLMLFSDGLVLYFPPSRYMPSKVMVVDGSWEEIVAFTYQTDSNGWVTSSTGTPTGTNFEHYSSRTNNSRFLGETSRFGVRNQASARNNAETWFMTFEYVLAR